MSRPFTYTQCRLVKNGSTQVSWIPSTFAQPGRIVDLKEDGMWTKGWEVLEVFPGTQPNKVVEDRARDHINHRKATDI
jgi:hypothetical protein